MDGIILVCFKPPLIYHVFIPSYLIPETTFGDILFLYQKTGTIEVSPDNWVENTKYSWVQLLTKTVAK